MHDPNLQLCAFDSQVSSIAGPCTPAAIAVLELNFHAIQNNKLQIILFCHDF